MTADTTRKRARIGALVTTTTLMAGGLVAGGGSAQAEVSAPTITVADVASKGVALRWNATGDNTYRIRISTSSSMTTAADAWDVRDNYYEWTHTDASPSAYSPRLTPGKKYYFQVKAIRDAASTSKRTNLSSYSKAVAVTLPKTALPELKPVDIKATPGGADTMYVSWRTRGAGYSYVLRYTSSPKTTVTKWKSLKTDASGATIKKLVAGKKYYFRVRVIDPKGTGQSPYSAAGPSATTSASTPSPGLTVATYNVRKMASVDDWTARRKAVAANILAAAPDVAALQEATPVTYKTNGRKQWADVMALLGSPYKLVTSGSGSSGTQLAYNSTRVSVVKSGIKMLTEKGDAERYAVWAILKDKLSSKTFFAVSTHLEPGTSTPELNEVRIQQAKDVLDVVRDNAGGRPTVIVGDMNSSRAAEPTNGQYGAFLGGGFVDPIDNTTATWSTGANATAEHIMDSNYNSGNKFQRLAPLTAFPNGTHIDYTYVSPRIRVATWRMVVKVDGNGSFIGTIPSDHNLIKMTIHLP
ncbi:MAG: hypothetical protein JWQ91_3069 [Aeromicrobium sp.]|uniref:endonuclease/exonuclease/phosphatase family protein n=1 Tax=Aeromicrobium sp. TaxID=1871063 RepID=UPI002626F619|nr:endonuclease/exonuclease/phosphatase family protein [Aeromicrobium sp.]MCW2826152.1 hypothetical protein [Aeromicrobium sp.]